jgi:CheY-like chemotaxis protein
VKDKAFMLLVDDEAGAIETLCDVLPDLGYQVDVAVDGLKAVEKARSQAFNVILMDVKMPKFNGVEVYKAIKRHQPEIVVIMMTGYSVENLIDEALRERVHGVLEKPIDIEEAIEFIRDVTESAMILVNDDDPSTCEVLLDVLEERGYHVFHTLSGEEALMMMKERVFDIAFIDVKMHSMNGLQVCLALKRMDPRLTTVLITGYPRQTRDLVNQAIGKYTHTCLYKLFDMEKAITLIAEVRRDDNYKGGESTCYVKHVYS